MIVIGIDPGLSGAIACLSEGQYVDCCDVPTMGRGVKGQQINAPEAAKLIRAMTAGHVCLAVIEEVHAMPKQGVSSSFRFGQSDGVMRGIVSALGIPMLTVTPKAWKKRFGLIGTDKDTARGKAQLLFPMAPLSRKKDVGRADALLIARWGWDVESTGAKAA